MSFIINLLLNLSPEEFWCDESDTLGEVSPALDNINSWIGDGQLLDLSGPTYQEGAGAGMHAWLYGGGFKHFDLDGFIKQVEQQTWKAPQDLQLFIKVEEEDRFTQVDLDLRQDSGV